MSEETMYHLLPEDRYGLYDEDSPLDLAFRETLARSWVRVEYLNWDFRRPGDVLLGAPMTGITDFNADAATARDTFLVQDRRFTRPVNTLGTVPSLDGAGQNDLNGVRATIGIPFVNGTLEADYWMLQDFNYDIVRTPTNFSVDGSVINTFPLIPVTSLKANGVVVSDSIIGYNQNYRAHLGTSVLGTGIDWVQNPVTPNQRSVLSPILGFRYIRFSERLFIGGQDIPDPVNAPTTILNHSIDSRALNDIFGPQFGFRSETHAGRVTIGVEPKILFAVNRIEDSVETDQIFSVTETPGRDSGTRLRFTPALDLAVYAQIHVTPQLSVRVGYDLLWMGGIDRAYNIINYDAPSSPTEPPSIRRQYKLTDVFANGFVVGGEYTFR